MKKRKQSVKNVTSLPLSFFIDNIELQPLVIIAKTLAKNRIATFIGGLLYVNNPNSIFWFGSGSAVLLCLLLYLARVKEENPSQEQQAQTSAASINKKDVLEILKQKKFWAFALIIVGTASIYDVFDQQFPNYYVTFFATKEAGIDTFSKLCATQTALEAVLMVFAPALVNKIGAKRGLLLFGLLTFVRIAGSAFFTTPVALSAFRLIAAFEMGFPQQREGN